MTNLSAPGDTRVVVAMGVTQRDASNIAQPVTSGLTAMYTLLDWETGDVIDGPTAITLNDDDDWFLSVDAPAEEGKYRVKVVLSRSGAQRTLYAELQVKENTPT